MEGPNVTELSRRSFMLASAGAIMAASLPGRVVAAERDTLKIAILVETGNLDLLQNISGLNTYTLVFDPLIRYGAGGELLPALAESWTVAEDGLTITFKLREGVSFSDGAPFDSEAAKWNIERWAGVPDFAWIGIADAIDTVETDGPYGLVLNLKRPAPAGLMELALIRPVRFLSPQAVDADGNQTAPIGTGPWVITANDNSHTSLVRNEAYWGPAPAFGNIELLVVPDELARANALRAGDLDIIGGDWVSPLSPRRARALEADGGVTLYSEAGTTTMLLGYSPAPTAVVADKAVRDAIYVSIDRAAMAQVLFEGFADPIADLFPAVIPLSGTRHEVPTRDIAAAKALLTEGGWTEAGGGWDKGGTLLQLRFLVSEESLPGSRRVAEMIQGMLTETGIKVEISSVDNATMHDRRPAFDYDLTFFTTYGAPYDPYGSLGNMFLSNVDSGPDGKVFAHPDLDPILTAALQATTGTEAAMQAVYDWLDTNRGICPLVAAQRLWAYGPGVSKFTLPPTDYDMPFEGIELTS
ncbi:MAG: nickel ABC transporter substrate-binding protein [Pelagibacterium sp. SCN 63-23]|nr:MAG: nickel ABC transporter substrate-binding protein [Pelagibacterium sp. SCN 63-23]